MSSVAAAYSQVPTRSKYLVARDTTNEYLAATGVVPTSVSVTTSNFAGHFAGVFAGAPAASGTTGTMYRDKGKRVTMVDAAGKHLATFALVQQYIPRTGGSAFGVAEDPTSGLVYVQVWDAFNPARVTVVAGPA
jgi:hypothetical protein